MGERRLTYTERLRLEADGTLGDYVHEDMPVELRRALRHLLVHDTRSAFRSFRNATMGEARKYTEWAHAWSIDDLLAVGNVDYVLEMLELAVEANQRAPAFVNLEDQLNKLFDRWRFGFKIVDGLVQRIDSPVLSVEITGPALLAVTRPGWGQAEKSFHDALDHRRAGEIGDALTAANAAVEAALKAAGFKGNTLGDLSADFKNSPHIAGYGRDLANNLTTLLNRLMGWRSVEGDAHGKEPGAGEPPEELAALAIHWAGAFIVYLDAIMPR
jgi:hypothetical protein